ncbi:heterokaryon incompatibility protein-domain-containing protein [Cladorrhinum sp. PSN259]|nr:heterokaryon incompatibility protein-domain-containing protein [Cladorrhinum sp. PSN259]
MSAPINLCAICTSIPFDAANPPFGNSETPGILTRNHSIKLGALDHIRRRSCSLCQLVSLATQTVQRTEGHIFQPTQEVELLWSICEDTISKPSFNLIYTGHGPSRGTSLCFVQEDHPTSGIPTRRDNVWFRRIDNVVIDFERISSWLRDCSDNHGACASNSSTHGVGHSTPGWNIPGIQTMRFIDVFQDCIVEKTLKCRYITLSYVWGNISAIRLSKSNRRRLLEPGSLREAWRLLPRTIQDTARLVKSIGERYLWVDSLCLIQNDPDDVKAGTSVMDLIYETSALTVVAACGRDAGHGLPGVNSGSRSVPFYLSQVLPGLQLTIYTDLVYLLQSSVWASRGWTLQEEILSSRVLYFVNDQVFFQCGDHLQPESCIDHHLVRKLEPWERADRRPLANRTGGGNTKMAFYDLWEARKNFPLAVRSSQEPYWMFENTIDLYLKTIIDYTSRSLTFQQDAYNAIAGTIRRFESKLRLPFISGLPSQFFEVFIAFGAQKASLRRRKGFPSYSWAGWMGAVSFSRELVSIGNFNHQPPRIWIQWFCTVPDTYQNGWKEVVVELPALFSNPTPAISRLVQFGYTSVPTNCVLVEKGPSLSIPQDSNPVDGTIPNYPLLKFWTVSINFALGEMSLQSLARLVDNRGNNCGELLLDGHDESSFFDDHAVENKPLELIILMDGCWFPTQPRLFEHEPINTRHLRPQDYVIVMCIEWQEVRDRGGDDITFVSERRGIGQVLLSSVPFSFSPGPIWKEITLG